MDSERIVRFYQQHVVAIVVAFLTVVVILMIAGTIGHFSKGDSLTGTWRGNCQGNDSAVTLKFLDDGTVLLPQGFSGQWSKDSDTEMTVTAPFVGSQQITYSIDGDSLNLNGPNLACTLTRAS